MIDNLPNKIKQKGLKKLSNGLDADTPPEIVQEFNRIKEYQTKMYVNALKEDYEEEAKYWKGLMNDNEKRLAHVYETTTYTLNGVQIMGPKSIEALGIKQMHEEVHLVENWHTLNPDQKNKLTLEYYVGNSTLILQYKDIERLNTLHQEYPNLPVKELISAFKAHEIVQFFSKWQEKEGNKQLV